MGTDRRTGAIPTQLSISFKLEDRIKTWFRGENTLGRIRTCDLRFRRPPLYPAELRGQVLVPPYFPSPGADCQTFESRSAAGGMIWIEEGLAGNTIIRYSRFVAPSWESDEGVVRESWRPMVRSCWRCRLILRSGLHPSLPNHSQFFTRPGTRFLRGSVSRHFKKVRVRGDSKF